MTGVRGMTLAFAGAGAFGVPTLRRLVDRGATIVRVYTQPDKPAGRGKKLTPTPVAEAAASLGLDVVKTSDLNAEALPDVDVLVVIAFGQKIAAHVTESPRFGAINLHASLLPKYRGAAPIHAAVLAGETVVGNSVIRLAEKMDAGAVLGTRTLAVGPVETTGELHDRLADAGGPLVEQVLEQLRGGHAVEVPQDPAQATLARKLNRETTRIDFTQPARVVADRIRGLYPWPGCRVRLVSVPTTDGTLSQTDATARAVDRAADDDRASDDATDVASPRPEESAARAAASYPSPDAAPPPLPPDELARLTLVRARVVAASGPPGTVLADGAIACGQDAIEVIELQPEGRRPMTLAAYRNGRPWPAGARIESVV